MNSNSQSPCLTCDVCRLYGPIRTIARHYRDAHAGFLIVPGTHNAQHLTNCLHCAKVFGRRGIGTHQSRCPHRPVDQNAPANQLQRAYSSPLRPARPAVRPSPYPQSRSSSQPEYHRPPLERLSSPQAGSRPHLRRNVSSTYQSHNYPHPHTVLPKASNTTDVKSRNSPDKSDKHLHPTMTKTRWTAPTSTHSHQ